MDVIDIIKDAFYYPINDYKNWLIIGILFLLSSILTEYVITANGAVGIIGSIINLLISILIVGIGIAVIKASLGRSSEIPMIDIANNFIDGIKSIIISIIYFIIPAIIVAIISIPVGVYSNTYSVIESISKVPTNVTVTPEMIIQAIPQNVLVSFATSAVIIALIALILMIIFALFEVIAQVRFAETGSIAAAIDIKAIFDKISSIGWGKYIIYIIAVVICLVVITIIMGILTLIPYIGVLISEFVFASFALLFLSRCRALIYMEG